MADPQQKKFSDVLSKMEAQDKEGTNLQDVYDFLSLMPGTGDVIGAYEAPGIISAGVEKTGEEGLSEKAKGLGIAALGTMGLIPVAGKPARAAAKVFSKIDTPVYHYTPDAELGFTVFDPNRSPNALDALGTHVGTAKAARDRFKTLQRRNLESGSDLVTGNLGRDEAGNIIPRTTRGGTYPLNADLSKPYTPDKFFEGQVSGIGPSKEVWGESDIYQHLLDEYNKKRDTRYTMRSLVGDEPDFPFSDFRKFIGQFRRKLAEDGFTHLPYYNEVEDYGSMSYVMLTDRPKGSTKVLQSPFAKKDPEAADDPDIMKAEGGVVSMKDKAVNMTRKSQGIEPFIKFVV